MVSGKGSKGAVDGGGGGLERECTRVRMNLSKPWPKHEISDTYGCMGTRWSSRAHRRRELGTEAAGYGEAVASSSGDRRKGEMEGI